MVNLANWQQEEPTGCGGGRQLSMDGTSRVNREIYARFCERLRVEFPGAARRWPLTAIPTATQPRARPTPGTGIRCQASADRVVLDIANQTVQLRFVAHTMVEGFILPEGLPRSAKNQVGWSRGGAFPPTQNHR